MLVKEIELIMLEYKQESTQIFAGLCWVFLACNQGRRPWRKQLTLLLPVFMTGKLVGHSRHSLLSMIHVLAVLLTGSNELALWSLACLLKYAYPDWRVTELELILVALLYMKRAYSLQMPTTDAKRAARQNANQLYGKAHSLLNTPATAMWQNMGYWSPHATFPEACMRLVCEVAESVGLDSRDSVLDFGYGCGEEINLLQQKYAPRSIRGCTSHAMQNEIAQNLCASFDSVELSCADALAWTQSYDGPRADCAVVVDAVYHFRTRRQFLKSLKATCLGPGGRVALADIVLSDTFGDSRSFAQRLGLSHPLFWVLKCLSVPAENMLTMSEYTAMLQGIGYRDVSMRIVTAEVFPGLATYIEDRTVDYRWIGFYLFAKLLRWWTRNHYLEYVIVSARTDVDSN